jgi:hypothetical protein
MREFILRPEDECAHSFPRNQMNSHIHLRLVLTNSHIHRELKLPLAVWAQLQDRPLAETAPGNLAAARATAAPNRAL